MAIPELKIVTADPLKILSSTKLVLDNARFVSINADGLDKMSKLILKRHKKGLSVLGEEFSKTGGLDSDFQLVFIEDAVNFCFWPDKDNPKWQVEWPKSHIVPGGWYGLAACFERGLANGTPILDAKYLSTISLGDAKKFFQGVDDVEIPLLKERIKNLQEAGKVLLSKFGGKFSNVVEESQYDAIKLVKLIIENLSSFRDISVINGKEICFLKRAQICANDTQYALKKYKKKLDNFEMLTAFADYKLPQVLRMFGVLEYTRELSDKIDNLVEIPHDSNEEIEIRAATIWAIELLRQEIQTLTAGEIDNTIWFISQDIQKEAKPYHRTRTIYY